MYKKFSYVFGLGTLLLLASCDGNKQSMDGKQESSSGSQEVINNGKEDIKATKKVSSGNQTSDQSSANESQEDKIYNDINSPIEIEPETSDSATETNVENVSINNVKEEETPKDNSQSSENDVIPPQTKKSSANIEPVNNVTPDPVSEPIEKDNQSESQKTEETPASVAVDNANKPAKTESMTSDGNTDSKINDSTDSTKSSIEEVPPIDTNEGIIETNDKAETPEVSMVSDVPLISEEPIAENPSEVNSTEESTQNIENVPELEPVNVTEG